MLHIFVHCISCIAWRIIFSRCYLQLLFNISVYACNTSTTGCPSGYDLAAFAEI